MSKWVYADTAISGFTTGSGDCYIDDPNNVSVSDGKLHLTSRVLEDEFTCHSPFGNFTTRQTAGSVVSWGKFSQTYGRFEFRAKFPENATWDIDSALWMSPQKLTYGAWPNSGEIDVAEWFGPVYGNRAFPSVHYAGEDRALSSGRNCVVSSPTSEYHTYAVVWTPSLMSFYYDDKLCWEHEWTPNAPLAAPKPFDHPFTLVMTQTGGYNRPVGTTVTMEVDWVRVWK